MRRTQPLRLLLTQGRPSLLPPLFTDATRPRDPPRRQGDLRSRRRRRRRTRDVTRPAGRLFKCDGPIGRRVAIAWWCLSRRQSIRVPEPAASSGNSVDNEVTTVALFRQICKTRRIAQLRARMRVCARALSKRNAIDDGACLFSIIFFSGYFGRRLRSRVHLANSRWKIDSRSRLFCDEEKRMGPPEWEPRLMKGAA